VRDAVRDACPYGFSSLSCSFGFFGDRETTRLPVEGVVRGQVIDGPEVELRPFNYCGIDVANVLVEVPDSGGLIFHEPVYLSPCKAL
jgi:hypothetical protein